MPPVALICPGQGAQRAGGLADLPRSARRAFDAASEAVGEDLRALGSSADAADEERLRSPSVLQPYLAAWAAAEWGAAVQQGLAPERVEFVTGHSSGMNSALALSGAVGLEEALRFARETGLRMDEACASHPGGLLAVVGAGRGEALRICEESGARFANHNAPDQTVLGGDAEAIDRAEREAEAAGHQTVRLRVAGAFHTEAFRESDRGNEALIEGLPIREGFTPIVGNCRGQLISTPEELREELRGQYTRPVEWMAVLETLHARGVRTYATLGPGNAMAGLVRRFGRARGEAIRTIRPIQQIRDE